MTQDPSTINEANPFGEVIFSYSRAEAINDGVLHDVSELAREAGFVLPVAITAACWADCVAWSATDSERQVHQDETGRLWDVLFMASIAIRSTQDGSRMLRYAIERIPRDGRATRSETQALKLIVGPGDHSEPVITIMLPYED